jgi:hypothetical protein
LLYPREAGRGSDLCVPTAWGSYCPPVIKAVPAPAPVARPGAGRRSRRRAPPRAGPRPVSLPRPQAPAVPRGRPVTISRPVVVTPPRVVTAQLPAPRSLPPAVVIQPGEIRVNVPRSVPGSSVVPATPTVPAWLPAVAALVLPSIGAWATPRVASPSSVYSPPAVAPSVRPLPGVMPGVMPGTIPGAVPGLSASPLTQPQAWGLTSPAVAPLAQNCSCTNARSRSKKRKKKPCRNPVISSRKSTVGGRRFITIKKELKCPA